MHVQEATNHPDPIDRAAAETSAHDEHSLNKLKLEAARKASLYPPRSDGYCACGCDNEVDPRRLALGYGLTLECAARMERR